MGHLLVCPQSWWKIMTLNWQILLSAPIQSEPIQRNKIENICQAVLCLLPAEWQLVSRQEEKWMSTFRHKLVIHEWAFGGPWSRLPPSPSYTIPGERRRQERAPESSPAISSSVKSRSEVIAEYLRKTVCWKKLIDLRRVSHVLVWYTTKPPPI